MFPPLGPRPIIPSCTSAPFGDGLAFLATARGRQARTQGGPICGHIGPTEDAAWRPRAPPETHCLLPEGALIVQGRGKVIDRKRRAVRRHDEVSVEVEHAAHAGDVVLAALGEP